MSFFWSAVSYVAAFVVILLADLIITFATAAFIPLLRRVRSWYPIFSLVVSSVATFVGIWAFAAIAAKTPLRASVAMIAIPALLTYRNDRQRVQKVLAGVSGPKVLLAQHGESYDAGGDLWNERANLLGHVIGFALGFSLLFSHEPFW
jgi:hypothetical protein